jgi:hypothetical protein
MSSAARKTRLFLMLKAFIDECTDAVNVYFMAGWLAHFEEWERFSIDWEKTLNQHPRIEYFKNNDAMGLKGQFLGWDERSRDEKVVALARVVSGYKMTGFICGLGLPSFKKLFSENILPPKVMRSIIKFTEPYHFCVQGTIAQILGHQVVAEKNTRDRVDFVFDDGIPFLHDCIPLYEKRKLEMPEGYKSIAGTVIPGNDKEIVALQAADLLAGQCLSNARLGKSPEALDIMRANRIFISTSAPVHPVQRDTIQKSINALNISWMVKQFYDSGRTMTKNEFDNFEKTVATVLGMSHSELNAILKKEKVEKRKKPKKVKKSSVSREANEKD